MIIMQLRGRIGNQLFIYAFGRQLQEKYEMPLIFADNIYDTGGTHLMELKFPKNTKNVKFISYSSGYKYNYYNMKANDYKMISKGLSSSFKREKSFIEACKINKVPYLSRKQSCLLYSHKLISRKYSPRKRYEYESKKHNLLVKNGLFICENGWIDFFDERNQARDIFCYGYFQSEKYFVNIKDNIKNEIKSNFNVREELIPFINGIKNSNSVCLSIRMGDYLDNPILGVCTEKYYSNAIKLIYERFPDAKFYIFSDDVDAVRKKFYFRNDIITEPSGSNEFEKLAYMSQCKHFILSNSSFSWWAQYLSDNENKTVVAPSRWFRTDIPCDIYQDNWILLDC